MRRLSRLAGLVRSVERQGRKRRLIIIGKTQHFAQAPSTAWRRMQFCIGPAAGEAGGVSTQLSGGVGAERGQSGKEALGEMASSTFRNNPALLRVVGAGCGLLLGGQAMWRRVG